MILKKQDSRENWQEKVEALGFTFHSLNNLYWDESRAYEFTMDEILRIESATKTLHNMSLEAVQHIIDKNLFDRFQLSKNAVDIIIKSWNEEHPAIYGRFDLGYNPLLSLNADQLKMMEYNADTPTSLFEAAIVQWYWLQEINPDLDQFNSLHEKLIAKFKDIVPYLKEPGFLNFACLKDNIEDLTTVEYLRDCAIQAGLNTGLIYIEDIGFVDNERAYVDMNNEMINNIFKLYPWEWLIDEKFSGGLFENENSPYWIEPAWKMLISNKIILVILWELFPGHPLLLPTFEDNNYFIKNNISYVSKPILGREGNSVTINRYNGSGYDAIAAEKGNYGEQKLIYQQFFQIPEFDGSYPIIGSWMIDQEPAGIGIRENTTLITDNISRFIPHYISTAKL
jgi:glutathionylspermidine synthase